MVNVPLKLRRVERYTEPDPDSGILTQQAQNWPLCRFRQHQCEIRRATNGIGLLQNLAPAHVVTRQREREAEREQEREQAESCTSQRADVRSPNCGSGRAPPDPAAKPS